MPQFVSLVGPVLGWYIAVQLCALAALPLSRRLFHALPDRGYALAKVLGVLLVGYTLWLGTALGLARNDTGGAWLALGLVALSSVVYTRIAYARTKNVDGPTGSVETSSLTLHPVSSLGGHVLLVETLFLCGLLLWAVVRAYDPAANHTEQPMDLMFLNSIWHSPTYPPKDAWLAGYAIAYYYFGYWLLATVARLANTPPEVAYNVGQAAWFGLLLVSCYGVGYNMLAFGTRRLRSSRVGGLFAVCGIALAGNLQTVMEWLYANGAPVAGLARWIGVHNFPDGAAVTGEWLVSGAGWWWWRSSRVIHDRNLQGGHIEVIDEFPMFSYVLGDNHPHVIAMPVVLLVIGLAMNLLFGAYLARFGAREGASTSGADRGGPVVLAPGDWTRWIWVPGSRVTLALTAWAAGSLLFLNTWDFPPYWGLLVLCAGAALLVAQAGAGASPDSGLVLGRLFIFGGILIVGALVLYMPYLLTAQSQAGGLTPNFFNPTRIQPFLVMFGSWVPALGLLLWMTGRRVRPRWRVWLRTGILVIGAPVLFLTLAAGLALGTDAGQAILARMPLPSAAGGYGAIMLERWLSQGFTFLGVGLTLTVTVTLLWRWYGPRRGSAVTAVGSADVGLDPRFAAVRDWAAHARMGFALLLLFCGLVLVYLPEFVFLRDQFGTRMNTIFKFYYQAWLLFGLAGAYAVMEQLRRLSSTDAWGSVPAFSSVVMVVACLIFPVAAAYSKTGGFAATTLTLDATQYIQGFAPDVAQAMRWIRAHVPGDALVLEAEGRAYSPEHNRVSTLTGRPTLLGWPGHQRQWRGDVYGEMATGRSEAIEAIYRSRDPQELRRLLKQWQIDYVYVSPVERREYEMTEVNERTLAAVGDLVFEMGDVRIFRVLPLLVEGP